MACSTLWNVHGTRNIQKKIIMELQKRNICLSVVPQRTNKGKVPHIEDEKISFINNSWISFNIIYKTFRIVFAVPR